MPVIRSPLARASIALSILGVIGWFAGARITDGVNSVGLDAVRADAPLLAGAIAIWSVASLLLGASWMVLVESATGHTVSRRGSLLLAFAYSWLGRYVPGTVPFLAGRVYLGSRLGYPVQPLVVTTAVQGAIDVLVSTIIGACAVSLALGVTAGGGQFLFLAALPCAGLVALHPRPLRAFLDAGLRLLRRDPIPAGGLPSTRALCAASLLVAGNQILGGLGAVVVLRSVTDASLPVMLLAAGATSLAGVAGILVVFVPAGLGVRDGALAALLAMRLAVESAALVVVMIRLVTVVADLLVFGAALAVDGILGWRVAKRAVRGDREPRLAPVEPAMPAGAGAISERRAA